MQEGGSNDVISRQQRGFVSSSSCKRTRLSVDHLYRDAEAMNIVMNKAEEIKANLCRDHPVLVKILLPSHVKGGFSLGLLKDFCDDHMPMMDQMVELEDENGRVWLAKYLAGKQAFSGGWRGFSNHHKLVEGDVAVFELVRPAKFKVRYLRFFVRMHGENGCCVAWKVSRTVAFQ
ncbi:B3 domain-containing protein Os06g0194400 [Linum perenne]